MDTGTGTDFHWPPLESDPEIFSSYMKKIGMATDWNFSEIFGLDDELLMMVPQPCAAVIATIERVDRDDGKPGAGEDAPVASFYMKQTGKLDNACGIIACLHSILNNQSQISVGNDTILGRFISGTAEKTPAERATFLEEYKEFQDEHASQAGEGQSAMPSEGETKHHFVAFVKGTNNQLIELDGTKAGPAIIEENCEDLLKGVATEIKRRLADGKISESLSLIALSKQ